MPRTDPHYIFFRKDPREVATPSNTDSVSKHCITINLVGSSAPSKEDKICCVRRRDAANFAATNLCSLNVTDTLFRHKEPLSFIGQVAMEVNISSKRFKRIFWFVNEDQQSGVSIIYTWENFEEEIAHLKSNDGFSELSEHYEELFEVLEGVEWNEDLSIDMAMLSDAPGFGSSITLSHPPIDTSLADGFELDIEFSYVLNKAGELQRSGARNHWPTISPEFKFESDYSAPLEAQTGAEFSIMAKIWRSGCWHDFESLFQYMQDELGFEIEDETIEFVDRYL